MSTKYFECKVKYRKTDSNGVTKVVTESYVLDALSFTEAETRINEEMSAYIGETFKVTNIRLTNYAEIHPSDDADSWFKSKISLISYDEESGKERKTNMYFLVKADDVKGANERTIEVLKGTMGDYTIPAISETTIVDFFPYFSKE